MVEVKEILPESVTLKKKIEPMLREAGELAFLMFRVKGYKKEHVKYMVSQNELYLSVFDGIEQCHWECSLTLQEMVSPSESTMETPIDFIVFKLRKATGKKAWTSYGYEVSKVSDPIETKQEFISNYISESKPVKNEEEKQTSPDKKTEEEIEQETAAQTEVEEENDEEAEYDRIQKQLEKMRTQQVSHLNFNSSIIFSIY